MRCSTLIVLIASTAFLAACAPRGGEVAVPVDGKIEGSLVRGVKFGEPIVLGGSSHAVLIPVGVPVERKRLARRVGTASSRMAPAGSEAMAMGVPERSADMAYAPAARYTLASIEMYGEPMIWNNLILYDTAKRESTLLFDRRVVLTRVMYPAPHATGWPERLLLMGVVERDTDGDGLLTADDAATAYAALSDGTKLTALTPAGVDWQGVDESLSTSRRDEVELGMVLRGRFDADGNGEFDDERDEERYYEFRPGDEEWVAVPLIPEDVRERAVDIVTGG